jgi:hypothetical protein
MIIIENVKSRDPASAIKLYDRVIAELPVESSQVATAQYMKIGCYRDLNEYDHALEQCDVVSKMLKFENYKQQMPGLRERIKKQAEQGGAGQPATAPESKSESKENPKPESEARPQ